MEENFNLLAQSRANYYTKGSPVQFVQVEMLKGDVTGDIAVCLSFKNIGEQVLSGLVINFKCKDTQGNVVCESQYYYEDLNAGKGDVFGADDAVYISAKPVASVEVMLDRAFGLDGAAILLGEYKRVRLPAARMLPANLAGALQRRTGNDQLRYAPQVLENGWYCACGAFHPNEENTAECSECGADRVLLQNALSSLLQQSKEPAKDEQPTKLADTVPLPKLKDEAEATRVATQSDREKFEAEYRKRAAAAAATAAREEDETTPDEDDEDVKVAPDNKRAETVDKLKKLRQMAMEDEEEEDWDEEEYYDDDDPDELARSIIRWAPPITLVLCAIIAMGGYVWFQIFLK
ncbi:MAG: hypothetical protein IIV90_07575 [Oscillospiraceae bacterium]|nr:hypothetical protein [Oscillospiraceae bacterium]